MQFRNNVTRLLESHQIRYSVHTYDYEAGVHSATEVAAAINLPPERVYKTLVVLADRPDQKPMLVVLPGPDTLNLKALARAVGTKKLRMASHTQAESLTGLQTGGISPLALLNRGFQIYISDQAQSHDSIAVSAGQRGVNLELQVNDFLNLTGARLVDVS
jgi:Cys-tRNA(Pro)/Cys-tRNA(Cys) deacylase